jgi:hypothetical protein
MILLRLSNVFYMEVIEKILITYFFYCSFSHRIWYDLCSKCLILFRHCSWVNTIFGSWTVFSSFCAYEIDVSFYCLLYLEEKECLSSWWCSSYYWMIYREIISCIVSKVNPFHNMASLITNRRLHISWGFFDNIFNFVWLVFFFFTFLGFEGVTS